MISSLVSAFVLWGAASPLPAPARPQEPRHDLSVRPALGEPVLVELACRAKGELSVEKRGAEVVSEELDLRSEVRFVDEPTAIDGDDWETARTWVRWHETVNGRPADPELHGARVLISREDGVHGVQVDGTRMARKSILERLLDQAPFAGLRLGLPQDVGVGETFAVDAGPAAGTLLRLLEGELRSSEATLTLRSVDEEGTATLTGRLSAEVLETVSGVELETTYAGDWTVLVDVGERRVRAMDWRGDSTASGARGPVTCRGEMTFEITLETSTGRAAERAQGKKPTYRDVRRDVAGHRVSLELPSHWFELGGEDEVLFCTTIHASKVHVAVKTIDSPASKFDAVMDAAVDSIREEVGRVKVKKVSSPLGKGRSLRFVNDAGEETLVELFPLTPTKLVRIRLMGEAEAFDREQRSWTRVRRSLEVLER